MEFVTSLGYMPVTQEAFDQYLPAAVEKLSKPMYSSLYETYIKKRFFEDRSFSSRFNDRTKFCFR